jgi:epoxyqueuosine reductase QueG
MEQFKLEIKQAAKAAWVDLIGFAGRDRFEGLEARRNPFTLFPQGKTAILIARRITRGTLRGVEEGSNFGDYGMFGRNWLTDTFINQSTYSLAATIERSGWEAMPVVPGVRQAVSGVAEPVEPDFKYAAVACGLGEIGVVGEVLTPQYGPRQRFALIITDAELPADPLLDKPVCTRCGRCVAICPLQALDSHWTDVSICGQTMPVASCDLSRCAICKNGAIATGRDSADRLAALCVRTCVDELGQAGALDNTFETSFRKRQAWGKNEFGEAVDIVEGGQA